MIQIIPTDQGFRLIIPGHPDEVVAAGIVAAFRRAFELTKHLGFPTEPTIPASKVVTTGFTGTQLVVSGFDANDPAGPKVDKTRMIFVGGFFMGSWVCDD